MRNRISFRSEAGIALPVVMGSLVVLSLLAAALLSTAGRSSSQANAGRNDKRALGAAEAGLQTAAYRLKQLNPAGTMCMTTVAVAPTSGECPASTPEPVGAGATFSYTVTPKGATCGVLPGYTPTANDRCITSVGLVNGVKRRIQTRVEQGLSYPFAKAGVSGTEWVTLTDDVTLNATDVGSNGPITLTGSPKRVDILAAARPNPPGGVVTQTGTVYIQDGIVNSPAPYGLVQPDFAPSRTTNNNGALNTAYYDAATRSLSIPAATTYSMPAGTYNFCSVTIGSGGDLRMETPTAVAAIYLDSPRRAGSGCSVGSGQFRADGGTGLRTKVNSGRFDANVWVWVYGTTNDASAEDILLTGKANIDAVWYAPDSIFHATNDVIMHGGVVARKVLMNNKVAVTLDVLVKSLVGPGSGPLNRRAWFECTPAPTVPTDPESGC